MRLLPCLGLCVSLCAFGAAESDRLRAGVPLVGKPTVLACLFSQPACRPDYGVKITYRWDAKPLDRDYKAFVHIKDATGKIMLQDDHDLPTPTSQWSGPVAYTRTLVMPSGITPGEYKIQIGLYAPKVNGRPALTPGNGVTALAEDQCQIGVLKVTADAPIPALGAPTLNLEGYHVTFDEDFKDKELSVSAWGPGTRWIAHTPYNGDFGDARFANPTNNFPFTVENGILRIEARKTDKRWQSGLLSSVDRTANGFAQQYGYFEMRAKFPKGPGTWPAFWLLGVPKLKDKSATGIEIDVVEQYGVHPNSLHVNLHWWFPDKKHRSDGDKFILSGMADDFHRYGVLVTPDWITYYFDGVELRRIKTPEEAKVPMYLLVDLALGGGWPIDKTPNPSFMYVDYIRAWAK